MPRNISGNNDTEQKIRPSVDTPSRSATRTTRRKKKNSFKRKLAQIAVKLHLEGFVLSCADGLERFSKFALGKDRFDRKIKNVNFLHTNYLYRTFYMFKRTMRVIALSVWGVVRLVSPVVIPLAGAAILIFSVWGLSTYAVGLEVTIGDRKVYVESAAEFNRIQGEVQDAILSTGNGEYITDTLPTMQMMLVEKNDFTPADEIADILNSNYDEYVGQSYGFFLDGQLIATSKSGSDFDILIEQLAEYYLTGAKGETYTVLNTVETVRDAYPASYEMSYDELISLFTTSSDPSTYKVKKNDTIYTVAAKNGLTVPVLKLLNRDKDLTSLSVGTELRVGAPYRELRIQTVSNVIYKEVIPYETRYIKTDTMYENVSKVKQSGSNGSYEVTAQVITVNGVEISREVVSKKKLKDAIPKQVYVGIKTIAPSGYFIFPLDKSGYRYKSSSFGWRTLRGKSDFHRGLDLAAKYGTKIYAADGGVVYKKGWQENGLGNYIAIDHGNGIISYYGHCSKLVSSISVGEKVHQGQLIAYVGSTGNSTGNHLHFALFNTEEGEYFDAEPYIFKK